MIGSENWLHEQASRLAEAEREAGIESVRTALLQPGTQHCVRCGEGIEPERRAAMPSARRCVECQTLIERGKCK